MKVNDVITFCALRPSFSWFTFCFLLLLLTAAALLTFSSTFSSSSESDRFFFPATLMSLIFLRPSEKLKKLRNWRFMILSRNITFGNCFFRLSTGRDCFILNFAFEPRQVGIQSSYVFINELISLNC